MRSTLLAPLLVVEELGCASSFSGLAGAQRGVKPRAEEGGAEKRGQEEAVSASCPFLAPRASNPNWELRRVQTFSGPLA